MKRKYKFNAVSDDGTAGTDGLEAIAESEEEAREILLQDEATRTFEPNLTLVSVVDIP